MDRRTLPHLALFLALALLAGGCGEAGRYIEQAVDLAEQIGRTAEGVSKTSEALSKTARPWLPDEQGVSPFGVEAVDTVELGGVAVQVKECTISSEIVNCTFLFQLSPEMPSTEIYFAVTNAYTPDGQEVGASSVAIGNTKSGYGTGVRRKLTSAVNLEGSGTFRGVPPTLKSFQVISIQLNENELQFHNIPVTGS